jgi:hypothetical protein
MLPVDEQALMYHLLEFLQLRQDFGAEEALNRRTDGGIFNALRKVKRTARATPPFYDRLEVHHNLHEMRNFWMRLHGTIREIMAAKEALDRGADHHYVCFPSPRGDCRWSCSFWPVCPMFDDGSHAEGLLESAYRTHSPYEHYDMPGAGRGIIGTTTDGTEDEY